MRINPLRFLFILFILSISGVTQAHEATSDFCMHSFEQFAYEGPRDIEELSQLPVYPWQQVDAVLESVPENYYISHVELARPHNGEIEIWLGAGTYGGSWPTYVYAPQMFEKSERVWLVYNSQTSETAVVSAEIQETGLVVYRLFVDENGILWGSILPTSAYAGDQFPVLSVFNEATQQFELIEGMVQAPSDNLFSVQILLDKDGIFWVFAGDGALYSYKTQTRTTHREIELSGLDLRDVSLATDGTVYFSIFSDDPSVSGSASLAAVKIYQFFPETSTLTQIAIPEEWPIYRGLHSDNKGQLWLGSIGFRDRGGAWNLIHTDPALFFRDVMHFSWLLPTLIFESADGRLWYTNWWDGGIWFHGTAWYDPATGEGCMFTNHFASMVEDGNQQLWLAANGTLYKEVS